MDPTRFDRVSTLFAERRMSRRAAIATGSAGIAFSLGTLAFAQDATPVATPAVDSNDPHPSADAATAKTEFLFVQPFDAGTWAPKSGEDDVYTLTLTGAAANTVYFSDRPERIVGLSPTQEFLDGLGFTPVNPPNAAIVAQRAGSDEQDILVIELLNPVYDADAGTLTYDVTVLADYGEHGLAHLAAQQTDYELAETFGAGSLFIDDCPDGIYECVLTADQTPVGKIQVAQCYQGGSCTTCYFPPEMWCREMLSDDCTAEGVCTATKVS